MKLVPKRVMEALHNPHGFTNVLIAIVVVAVAAIMIMVTTIVISLFSTQIQNTVTGLSAAANSTLTGVTSASFGALNLLTVVLYVLAAVAIKRPFRSRGVGAVMGIFAYIRMKGD